MSECVSVCVCVWGGGGIRGNKKEIKIKGSVGYLSIHSQVCQTKKYPFFAMLT